MVNFTVADIPPNDAASTTEPITSSDPVCEVCGTGLFYGGRGRKPKYCDEHKPTASSTGSRAPRRSARDVESAMAALDSAHTSLSFLLMLLAGDAAIAWEAQRPALDERNRRILEMDPALAKRLANAAAKGGAPALVLSHLVAVAPAAAIAWTKVRANRATKETATSEPSATGYDDGMYSDPVDAMFNRG